MYEDITYDDIYNDTDELWNYLFFTGYQENAGKQSVDRLARIVLKLKIPNKELQIIFEDKIQEWFNKRIAGKNLDALHGAILSGDAETFQKELSKLLSDSISYMDSAENFYHGFMAGVLGVLAQLNNCLTASNRESGDGRGQPATPKNFFHAPLDTDYRHNISYI